MEEIRYTVADVRASYGPGQRWSELEGELPSFLLYRPLSFWITPVFLRLGIPATAVTLTAGLLSMLLPVVAWHGGAHAYVAIAAIALVVHVMDCIDGNIARTSGRTSDVGALLDGFVDLCFWSLYLVSIGLLVKQAGGGILGAWAVELSMTLAILVLLHRLLRDNYALRFSARAEFAASPPARLTPLVMAKIAFIGLEGLYAFAILCGGALGALDKVLAAIAVYVATIFLGAVFVTFDAARKRARSDALE
jgi:phosphatidylglycerophosphate synthase